MNSSSIIELSGVNEKTVGSSKSGGAKKPLFWDKRTLPYDDSDNIPWNLPATTVTRPVHKSSGHASTISFGSEQDPSFIADATFSAKGSAMFQPMRQLAKSKIITEQLRAHLDSVFISGLIEALTT